MFYWLHEKIGGSLKTNFWNPQRSFKNLKETKNLYDSQEEVGMMLKGPKDDQIIQKIVPGKR